MTKDIAVEDLTLEEARARIRELQIERDRFRRLADLSTQALVECDPSYRILAANRAYAQRFNLRPEDIVGREVLSLVGPEVFTRVKAAIESGEQQNFEVHANYPAIGERWMEIRYWIDRSANGEVVHIHGCATDITKRKQAELELCKTNTLLEGIIDTVEALIFVKDREGKYLLVNRTFEHAFNKHRSQIIGKTDFDIVTPEQARTYQAHDAKVLATGERLRVEEVGPVKGELHSYIVSKFPLKNETGEVEAVCGLATDITDIKRLQTTLQSSELTLREKQERLVAALEAADAGTFRWNIVTNDLDWDESLDRLFGLPPGKTARSLNAFVSMVHVDDRASVIERCKRCANEGANFDMEFRVIWPDGTEHWLYDRGKTVFDSNGKPAYMTGACVDVTERKNTEQRLRAVETRERIILEHLPVGVWFIDPSGNIVYGNRTSQQIWGGARYVGTDQYSEYKGWWHDTSQLLAGEDWAAAKVFHHRRPHLNDLIDIQCFDGTKKTIVNSAAPVLLPNGDFDGIVVFNLDVTEQARMQSALRRSHDELEIRVAERTVKLQETIEALEAFSYSISHDMRSPLRTMQGFADELLREHASNLAPEGKDMLERIKRAAHRLDLLILDVLSYARVAKEDIELAPVNLDYLIGELIANFPSLQQPNAIVTVEGPLGQALGHPAFLSQVISNLLSNAVKFVAPGVQPRVSISAETQEGRLRISVKDNGIGIESKHADRLFQMFGRIHPAKKYEGTGIGLAVVKKAIERMGGQIGFDSIPSQGSTFWFTLGRHQ